MALAIGAGALLAWRWRSSGFDWSKFAATLVNVRWNWLALSLALVLATYVGRAVRWEVMLRPIRPGASLWNLFTATAIGFTAVVLFGRPGELVRPYLIAKKENVPLATQLAAWLVERVFDMLMVLLIFGLALSQVSRSAIRPGWRIATVLEIGGYTACVIGAICLAALVIMNQFSPALQKRLVAALGFLPPAYLAKIERTIASFGQGMQSTRSHWFMLLLAAYSLVEWVLIAASFFCLFRAFPVTAGFSVTDSLIFLGFVAFGSIVQIPGVGGGMQIVAVLVLTEFFGLSLESSSSLALVLWIVTFVVIVPFGLMLAFHEGIKWRNLRYLEGESQP